MSRFAKTINLRSCCPCSIKKRETSHVRELLLAAEDTEAQALRGPRPFGNLLATSSRSGFLAPRRCRRVWRLGETVPQVLLRICFCFLARSGTCVKLVVAQRNRQAPSPPWRSNTHRLCFCVVVVACVVCSRARDQKASVVVESLEGDPCGCFNATTATLLEKCRSGHGREPRTFFPALTISPKAAL